MKKQIKAVRKCKKDGVFWCLHIKYYCNDEKAQLTIYPVKAKEKPIGSAGGGMENGQDIADFKYYFDTYIKAAWWAKDLHPEEKVQRLDSEPSAKKDKEKSHC